MIILNIFRCSWSIPSILTFFKLFFSSYDFHKNAPGPQYTSDSIVYNHYSNPSDIILSSKPVNKYLKEHQAKYYNTEIGSEPTYHYTIGREKNNHHQNDISYHQNSDSNINYQEKNHYNDVGKPFKTKTYDFVIGEDTPTDDADDNRPPPALKSLNQDRPAIKKLNHDYSVKTHNSYQDFTLKSLNSDYYNNNDNDYFYACHL